MFKLLDAASFPGCLPDHVGAFQWAYWIPCLAFELVLVLLVLAKLVRVTCAKNRPPLVLTVLLRDSILYYGGVLVIVVCNLVTWTSVRVGLQRECLPFGADCDCNNEQVSLYTVAIGYVLDNDDHSVLTFLQTWYCRINDLGVQNAGMFFISVLVSPSNAFQLNIHAAVQPTFAGHASESTLLYTSTIPREALTFSRSS